GAAAPASGSGREAPQLWTQLRLRLDEVDERTQRCGHQTASGVVEERTREAQPPRLEHGLERAAIKMRPQPVLEESRNAAAGDRCVARGIARSAHAYEQGPCRIDPDHLAVALKLPWRHRPAGKAAAQAGVAEKLARVGGPAATIEVGRSGRGREALHA